MTEDLCVPASLEPEWWVGAVRWAKNDAVNHHLNLTPALYVDQLYCPHETLLMLIGRHGSYPSDRRSYQHVSVACSRRPSAAAVPVQMGRNGEPSFNGESHSRYQRQMERFLIQIEHRYVILREIVKT